MPLGDKRPLWLTPEEEVEEALKEVVGEVGEMGVVGLVDHNRMSEIRRRKSRIFWVSIRELILSV